jgi:hypothetical protein
MGDLNQVRQMVVGTLQLLQREQKFMLKDNLKI